MAGAQRVQGAVASPDVTLEPIEGPWKALGCRNAMLRFASAKE